MDSRVNDRGIARQGEIPSQRPIVLTPQQASLITPTYDIKQANTNNIALSQLPGLQITSDQPGQEKNFATLNPAAALAGMATSSSIPGSQFFSQKSINSKKSTISADPVKLISKRRLQDLVTKIDPTERLDPEAEDILLEIADEFIDSVAHAACRLAKHRKSQMLEVKDVQLHLERNWNIRIPGYGSDELRTIRKAVVPAAYMNKLAAINAAKSEKLKTSNNVSNLCQANNNGIEKFNNTE